MCVILQHLVQLEGLLTAANVKPLTIAGVLDFGAVVLLPVSLPDAVALIHFHLQGTALVSKVTCYTELQMGLWCHYQRRRSVSTEQFVWWVE